MLLGKNNSVFGPPSSRGAQGYFKSKLDLAILTNLPTKNTSTRGFSLLECLIGIVIIAIVVTAFTPPIFLTVASRIQNRRAEQALQLAQGEIDKVRRTVERGVYNDTTEFLPPQSGAPNNNVQQEPAPSSEVTIPADSRQQFSNAASQALAVDVNGDRNFDFIVQTYRTAGVRDTNNRLMAFGMGVRVYAYTARQNFGNLETRAAALTMTTGLGQQQRRPLAVMYTNVVRSDTGISLQCYQQFLGSGNFRCN
ncbi:prepilin-type N-terminal cleavage/methylation domain-containing protein [Aerosakkonemataceae cyanobacterium BLCC-F50]|uniref:Prepilin-type N-terminal cleavage/methylation domain-containing protein n=1 Tax=Floridaenema flaviceps BLCC-F50 TaxID=3153642 RepID=A0ABV4XU70_9CYAN